MNMNDTKQKFGLRIKELRQAKNWTQDFLAEKLGMETQNISRMEKGIHMPNISRIELLAEIFDVKICELFNFEHFIEREKLEDFLYSYIKTAGIDELRFLHKVVSADKERQHKS